MFMNYMHARMLVDRIVFDDIWSLKVCKTTEMDLLTPPTGGRYRPRWETLIHTILVAYSTTMEVKSFSAISLELSSLAQTLKSFIWQKLNVGMHILETWNITKLAK